MKPLVLNTGLAAAALLTGFFQLPSTPPMKMGLWEQTTVLNMTMTGAKMPPGLPTNQTVKSRSCYTEESWANLLSGSNKSCKFSNVSVTATHFSMDGSCAVMKIHVDGDFTNKEAGHGKVHLEMATPQMNMTSDSTFESHFISSDCGTLAPGKTLMMN